MQQCVHLLCTIWNQGPAAHKHTLDQLRGGSGALLVKLKGTTRDAVEAVVTLVCRGLIHVPTEGLERATPLAEQRLDVRARFDGVTSASSVGRERWARANQRDGG